MASYKPVTAALRVLEVLATVNRLYGHGTVGDIHHRTGIDKATVVRMLETLIAAGYVVRSTDDSTYAVTGKTLTLSASFDRHKSIVNIIAPVLQDFRQRIGWPSDVALFDQHEMLVVESSRLAGPLSFNRAPGFRAPVLGTSLGLAYLAFCTAETRAAFLAAADPDDGPWNALVADPARLDAKLERVRARGYATMHPQYSAQEYNRQIDSVGVPIMSGQTVFASVNVIYLKQAVSPEKVPESIVPELKKAAAAMGQALAARSAGA